MGLHSEYNQDKWGFTAKERGGVSRWKISKKKRQSRGILAEQRNRILTEGLDLRGAV